MKVKLFIASFMLLALVNQPITAMQHKTPYKAIVSDFSKAILAGYFLKLALKLATSKITVCGYEIHKKSGDFNIKLLAEVLITASEIFRRDFDGTNDWINSPSIIADSTPLVKTAGKLIGMRLPLPFPS
jgi:hypothetical protein